MSRNTRFQIGDIVVCRSARAVVCNRLKIPCQTKGFISGKVKEMNTSWEPVSIIWEVTTTNSSQRIDSFHICDNDKNFVIIRQMSLAELLTSSNPGLRLAGINRINKQKRKVMNNEKATIPAIK